MELAVMRNLGQIMAKLDLPYVKQYRDRTGVLRRYFRRAGRTLGVLPGDIGSEEFMEAYQGFLGKKAAGKPRSAPGTFGALVTDFYGSIEFANLKPNSKKLYRLILEPLVDKKGHKRLSLLTKDIAGEMIREIGQTRPGLANLTKGVLNRAFRVAVNAGKWHTNPFARLATYKIGTRHTWTEAELLAYEKRWPLGTRERLAYALLLYTGQRGGDVVKMHRRDIVAGEIHLVQQKTDATLQIPIHPELAKAMKAGPKGLVLIGDAKGRPIKRNAITNLIKAGVKAAGLDARCKAHGLRKAGMRRMAEGGASAKQLSAVSGHKTLKEVERYTAAADQPKLARAAIQMIGGAKKRTGVSNARKRSV